MASEIEMRAEAAFDATEFTCTVCSSKQDVLNRIRRDEADVMSVDTLSYQGESMPRHYAVRFDDRELGVQVRSMTMRGFGLG